MSFCLPLSSHACVARATAPHIFFSSRVAGAAAAVGAGVGAGGVYSASKVGITVIMNVEHWP
jgi:hypothetical protein